MKTLKILASTVALATGATIDYSLNGKDWP